MSIPYYTGFDQIVNYWNGAAYAAPGLIKDGSRKDSGELKSEDGTAGGAIEYHGVYEPGGEVEVVMTPDTIPLMAYGVRVTWPLALVPTGFQVGNTAACYTHSPALLTEMDIIFVLKEVLRARFAWIAAHEGPPSAGVQVAGTSGAVFTNIGFALNSAEIWVQRMSAKVKTGADYFDAGTLKATGYVRENLGVYGGLEEYELTIDAHVPGSANFKADVPSQTNQLIMTAKDTATPQKTLTCIWSNLKFNPSDYAHKIVVGKELQVIGLKLGGKRGAGTVLSWAYV